MHKFVLVFLISFASILVAKDLNPDFVYKASGGVTDIVYENSKIYVATDASSVDIFDTKEKKLIQKVQVPQIKDFMGDIIDSKIYTVDVLNNNVLLTAQASKGFREIHLFSNQKVKTIIDISFKMFISKAKFIDENKIIFSLLSNEMFLYDIKNKKILWQAAISGSKFSDFALNESKTKAVVADESGDLKIVNVANGKIIKILEGQNLDNVFKVDYKSDKIITAGQDRRSVVYDLITSSAFYNEANFLIYGAGLSPSAKLGAYSSDEDNNVIVFNTNTKSKRFKLVKNLMTLSSILFLNENEIFVTTDSDKFNYYNLKNK